MDSRTAISLFYGLVFSPTYLLLNRDGEDSSSSTTEWLEVFSYPSFLTSAHGWWQSWGFGHIEEKEIPIVPYLIYTKINVLHFQGKSEYKIQISVCAKVKGFQVGNLSKALNDDGIVGGDDDSCGGTT